LLVLERVSPGMNELSLYFSGMNGGGGSRGAGQTPGPHVIAGIAVIGKEKADSSAKGLGMTRGQECPR